MQTKSPTVRPARQPPRGLLPVLALIVGFAAGALVQGVAEESGAADEPAAPLAYVIVSGRLVDADADLSAYAEAAGPLAQAAGIEVLARADAADMRVMEGAWPHADGFVAIETFRSMDDFAAFWDSPGYQEAIKLRDGKVELDFVVALPGAP